MLLWKYKTDGKGMWWKRMAKKEIEESHERKSEHSIVCVLSQQVRVRSYCEVWEMKLTCNLDCSMVPPHFSGCNVPKWSGGAISVRVVYNVCTCRCFLSSWKWKSYFKTDRILLCFFLIAARFVTFLKREKAYWQEKQQLENEKKNKQKNIPTKQHNPVTCASIVREQECMWVRHNITQKGETNAVSAISCIFTASKRPVSFLYPHHEHRSQLILQM